MLPRHSVLPISRFRVARMGSHRIAWRCTWAVADWLLDAGSERRSAPHYQAVLLARAEKCSSWPAPTWNDTMMPRLGELETSRLSVCRPERSAASSCLLSRRYRSSGPMAPEQLHSGRVNGINEAARSAYVACPAQQWGACCVAGRGQGAPLLHPQTAALKTLRQLAWLRHSRLPTLAQGRRCGKL